MASNSDKKFICKHCAKELKTMSSLRQHERRHDMSAPYVCCNRNYFSKCNFQRHRCNIHGESKAHVCTTCGKSFATNWDLLRHQKREEKKLPFTCNICLYQEESRSKLEDHMHKHDGMNTHACPHCNIRYKYRSGLSRHIKKKHTYETTTQGRI